MDFPLVGKKRFWDGFTRSSTVNSPDGACQPKIGQVFQEPQDDDKKTKARSDVAPRLVTCFPNVV